MVSGPTDRTSPWDGTNPVATGDRLCTDFQINETKSRFGDIFRQNLSGCAGEWLPFGSFQPFTAEWTKLRHLPLPFAEAYDISL